MTHQETVAEILDAARIRLKSHAAGHTEHLVCPKCDGGRTREVSLSVTVDADGRGVTWVCHRGQCGFSGGERIASAPPPRSERRGFQTPPPAAEAEAKNEPDWMVEFFFERKIGTKAFRRLGIYGTERTFPHPTGKTLTIVFPYRYRGEVVNRKYRPFPAKNPMLQEKNALPTLFNVDSLGDNPEEIVFCEGEMDIAAMVECGIFHAVTLKDGAPAKVGEINPDAPRFEALKTHADMLAKAKRIVLAGDSDVPGLALREHLARRLGRHRCHLVTWPEDCKDAGDVLRQHGPEAVLEALRNATPYPIDGLQRIEEGTLMALRALPPPRTMGTGARATDGILKLPTEGRLVIVTGFPGHGKTNWIRYVMIHTIGNHNRRWAVFSPEMQPWQMFAAECAEVWSGKPFYPIGGIPAMSREDVADAERWLKDRVTMLVCDAGSHAPTLDWVIERGMYSVLRDGTTDLWIDPWNQLDHSRKPGITETDYIGQSLQRLSAFGLRYGCNVWINAHPAKPMPTKDSQGKSAAPGPYDISGSSHWFNRADMGITVHKPGPDRAEIHLWKSRYVKWWGRSPAVASLDFDPLIGRYSTPIETYEPTPHWQEKA